LGRLCVYHQEKQLCLCDNWYSLFRICSCIPDSHPNRIPRTKCRINMVATPDDILYGWLSGMQEHMLLHTRQSSTQNNKYQVSRKHSCFSWWWTHSRTEHVDIDKYTKSKYTNNELFTKLALFTRLITVWCCYYISTGLYCLICVI